MTRYLLVSVLVAAAHLQAKQPTPADETIHDALKFDAKTHGVCEVHHVRMERRLVPVVFGYPGVGQEWAAVMSRYFPHSLLHIEGGCAPDQKYSHARLPLYVCPKCKRAEREWAQKHRETREAQAILAGKDAIRPHDSG